MLIGYNNDVEYRGKEFHIQTEDLGKEQAKIESQIFHQGQILDTEIVEYDSVLEEKDEEAANKQIKSMLSATHRGLYKRLISGEYDEMVGLDPLEEEKPEDVADPDEFEPGQERVPDAAQQIEEEGEEVFQQFHEKKAQKHVDLDNLKDHLEEVDSDADEAEEASEAEPESEVDEALAGVGSQLGELTDGDALDESGVDSNETIPPGSMSKDDVAEVSVDESLEDTSKVKRTDASERRTGRRSLRDFPSTGVAAYRGCEEPEGTLSIVPLVESFLEG